MSQACPVKEQRSTHLMTVNEHPHVITSECPVPCLSGVLPARTLNALGNELRGNQRPHGTVADVVNLYLGNRLSGIRGIGVGSIAAIQDMLVSAGLISEAGESSETGAGNHEQANGKG